jgi:hypothetical protein
MFGQILSSVTGLATSWLDSKAQQKLLETEIKKSSSLVKLTGNWKPFVRHKIAGRMNYVLLITQQLL